jgi:protein TonB
MKVLKLLVPAFFLCVICATNVSAQDNKGHDEVFRIVENMPVYPGGKEALRNDIAKAVKYPEEAKKEKIQGKVYVSFVVDKDGKVVSPKIERGVSPSLDKEALRVIKSLEKEWKPGSQRGIKVKVQFTLPINFALS